MEETKFMIELAVDKSKLELLVDLIMDNVKLSYTGEDLRIANEETVLQFIKCLYPSIYQEKLEELKK